MYKYLLCLGLVACQAPGQAPGAQPTPQATGSGQSSERVEPCTADCLNHVIDGTVHQSVSVAEVCAGQSFSVKLSNLSQAAPEAKKVSLIIVSDPNVGRQLAPYEKGIPPRFGFGEQADIELASAEISPEGTAEMQVQLKSEYGPDPSGSMIYLQPGKSNALLYIKAERGIYSGLGIPVCPKP